MMTGGGVGEGLGGGELVAALVTGVVLLAGLATQGVLGQRTGRTLASLTAGPLGSEGSRRTASVVMLAMMVGWFGVNVGVAGVALARLVGMPDLAGVVLFALIMLAVVGFGLGVLSWSALVAGLATTTLAVYGLQLAFADRDATLSGGPGRLRPDRLPLGRGAGHRLRRGLLAADAGLHPRPGPHPAGGLVRAGRAGGPDPGFRLRGGGPLRRHGHWDLSDCSATSATRPSPTCSWPSASRAHPHEHLVQAPCRSRTWRPRSRTRVALAAVPSGGHLPGGVGFDGLLPSWLTIMAMR